VAGVQLRQIWGQRSVSSGEEWAAAVKLLDSLLLAGKGARADAGLLSTPVVQKGVEKGGYLG